MKKERILLVGQHPYRYTGNGNMLFTCLEQINTKKYDVVAFLQGNTDATIQDPFLDEHKLPCTVITAKHEETKDAWGKQKLINILNMHEIDQLIFIGIDIWRYAELFKFINKLKIERNFVWKVLVPYDLDHIRKDWIEWMNAPDFVFVYSEDGYERIKEHVPNIEYFRPYPRYAGLLSAPTKEEKDSRRKELFPDIEPETTVFGFIGTNQTRKNVFNMLWGMHLVVEERTKQIGFCDFIFYMHIGNVVTKYNINQLAADFNFPTTLIRHNGQSRRLFPEEMRIVYQSIDALLVPSMQEGLSWTVIEAMKSGVIPIISDSTAHKDYIKDDGEQSGVIAIPTTSYFNILLPTISGPSYVRGRAPSPVDIRDSVLFYLSEKDKKALEDRKKKVIKFGGTWLEGCSHFSKILEAKKSAPLIYKENMGELI